MEQIYYHEVKTMLFLLKENIGLTITLTYWMQQIKICLIL